MSASRPPIDYDGGTGGQVIADRRDIPFPGCLLPSWAGRHRQNAGRLQIGTLGAITSERWAASNRYGWAGCIGIRTARADTLTDLERAGRFLYLQRTAFGGKLVGQNFGVAPGTPARFDITKLGAILESVHERLAGVVIERMPWPDLLDRYDGPQTLFYLDPPYWGCENDYGVGLFTRDDFTRLAARLATLRGRFLLSLNDVPEVRELFADFRIEQLETTYTIGGGANAGRFAELLISGHQSPRDGHETLALWAHRS